MQKKLTDNITPEPIEKRLEEGFKRVTDLFSLYCTKNHLLIESMQDTLELQSKQITHLENEKNLLLDSMKQVTIVPDEHQFAQKMNFLKQKANELLQEAISFREYTDSLMVNYYLVTKK